MPAGVRLHASGISCGAPWREPMCAGLRGADPNWGPVLPCQTARRSSRRAQTSVERRDENVLRSERDHECDDARAR